MNVTRRKLARMLASASVAAAAIPAVPVPIQAQPPPASGEETQSARAQLRDNAQQLAKVKIPDAAEPAFHFKA